jgi:hypothetical protein
MALRSLVIVRLDNPKLGAGPGTVVARAGSVAEFLAFGVDRDGVHSERLRLWVGDFQVGARVSLGAP